MNDDLDTIRTALRDWKYHCYQHRYGGLAPQWKRADSALDALKRVKKVGLDLPLMTVKTFSREASK